MHTDCLEARDEEIVDGKARGWLEEKARKDELRTMRKREGSERV